MSLKNRKFIQLKHAGLFSVIVVFTLIYGSALFAHGPKGHTEGFTALEAVKKATQLYDKLVATGKLDPSWETGLEAVNVKQNPSGNKEVVVQFSRKTGDPRSVFIFFNAKGDYSGSNFSGE